tara:strand:+ start:190 stop:585 length:396 start_codon:yes stop_codon:yes gene_type:complete
MQKVRVYWNLHRKCWSIQDCKSGLVIDHKAWVVLEGNFVVRKGGQKRVRQEGKKNVHAFAVGYIQDWRTQPSHMVYLDDWDRVKYNPYTDDYFMHKGEDHDKWNEIPRDFVGIIHMESLHHENGVAPRVYI